MFPAVVLAVLLWAPAFSATENAIGLAGDWSFQIDPGGMGIEGQWWRTRLPDRVKLPGSLQEQGFGDEVTAATQWIAGWGVERTRVPDWRYHPMYAGYREPGRIRFPYWLQPERHYVGQAWYQREIDVPAEWSGKRITLFLERCHWKTTVWLGGRKVGENDSLGAPHVYDLPPGLSPGRHRLTILVDNRMIHNLGVNAHSVGDQTQTAWNGIIGRIELNATDPVWIDDVQVYPDLARKLAHLRISVGNATGKAYPARLNLSAAAYNTRTPRAVAAKTVSARITSAARSVIAVDYPMGADFERWDEFQPALYRLSLDLTAAAYRDRKSLPFGMREFAAAGTRFSINGRPVFLRGTLDCAIFPLTGYPPTDVDSWLRILRFIKSYGLNHVRFHSWFPPEAAFIAADREGVYLQPECHLWATVKTPELHAWLREESARLLRDYGNHPSFVMMALGNESAVEHSIMRSLLAQWKQDPRHLYAGPANANGSVIPEYEYYVAAEYGKERVRYRVAGYPPNPRQTWFVTLAPQTTVDYRKAVQLFGKPLVSHEIVSRSAYPDLDDARKYTGSLKAGYFDIARDQLEERHMLGQMKDFVRASGKWQVQQFKEEIEAALRTPGFAGFQLLDLQDFTGQGGALVGVADAFWDAKSYVTPREFRAFCGPTVPLVRMPKRVWRNDERFAATVEVAHFGARPLRGAKVRYRVLDARGKELRAKALGAADMAIGEDLSTLPAPAKYRLVVELPEAGAANDWEFWVFPGTAPKTSAPGVTMAKRVDERLLEQIRDGATVLLLPGRDDIRGDIPQCFTSIRWSCPWSNGGESETLGLLANPAHPVFRNFPTDEHSNWQWWELLVTARPMILDAWGAEHAWPKDYRPLIQLIDDWNQNRKLAVLAEARLGRGKIVVCSMDLESEPEKRIVARQFRHSLLGYMESAAFQPTAVISAEQLRALFK